MSSDRKHVLIIGGGVVGLCSAYYLVRSGFQVTIVDRSSKDDSSGCSFGNAGFIVPSHFVPLAAPGIMSQGLKWMLRSDSPFYVKPRVDLDLMRWTMLFNHAATKEHVQKAAPVLRDLSLRSLDLYKEMENEIRFGLQRNGLRMMYQTEKGKAEELEMADHAAKLGIEAREISSVEVQDQEPDVKTNVLGAVMYPSDASLNPSVFMQKLRQSLTELGVVFKNGVEVQKLNLKENRIEFVTTDSERLFADEYVIAGGAWSQEIVKTIGLRLPIQAGKGYGLNSVPDAPRIRIPSMLTEAKVAVGMTESGMRFGGTMELAGINKAVSINRVEAIKKAVTSYFPNIEKEHFSNSAPWVGLRPVSPDGLPYIGRTEFARNVTIATGHAMLGMSLGPVSGEYVAAIISGNNTITPSPMLSPDRFQ